MYPHVGCCVLVYEQTAQHIMQQYVSGHDRLRGAVEGRGRRLRHRAAAVGSRHSASLGLGSVGVARTYLFTLRWLKCQCCC